MSIERLEEIRKGGIVFGNLYIFLNEVIDTFKNQSGEIADLRQELAKKEDAINIGDVIKEARLRNG